MSKLSVIITCDTRPGWLADRTYIGEHGDKNLCGCKSVDFLTHATIARNRFLESPLITERETILCVDLHEEIPPDVQAELDALVASGEITRIVYGRQRKDIHRWNDAIYTSCLRHATGDLVAKFDGDCCAYKRADFDWVAFALKQLDAGHAYVCQQSELTAAEHKMVHASTRFFFTRRETLDMDEAERCLDDKYRARKFPGKHLPCLEHILGALCDSKVIYPMADFGSYVVFSWSEYFAGTIPKLNDMPYSDVRRIIVDEWGVHGAADVIGRQIQ